MVVVLLLSLLLVDFALVLFVVGRIAERLIRESGSNGPWTCEAVLNRNEGTKLNKYLLFFSFPHYDDDDDERKSNDDGQSDKPR